VKHPGENYLIADGIASWIMATLTGNPFLVTIALYYGASNFVIGLLAAIPPALQLLQIPSIYLVEYYRRRRPICVSSSVIARTLVLFIAILPWLFHDRHTALIFLVLAIAVQSAFGAISVCSWNSWMRDFLPQDKMGSIYSRRLSWAFLISTILNISTGFFLDHFEKFHIRSEIHAYSVIYFVGFLAGISGLFFLSRIPEPPMVEQKLPLHLTKIILEPFKQPNFRNLIIFLGAWNFAVFLAAPFFTVYMLKMLGLSMSAVIGFTVISQIANFASFRLWGSFCDRFSNKTVLSVNGPLFIFCIFAWTFTRHGFTIPLLIVIHSLMGIATAGITLSTQNIALKLAPREKATGYLAANSMITSLASGLAPLLGGLFADFFSKRQLVWSVKWTSPDENVVLRILDFSSWDFFFFIAFAIGLYSLHRLAYVQESGEVKEKIVLDEILFLARREMRNISSVGGLRNMSQLPLNFVRYVTKPKRTKK